MSRLTTLLAVPALVLACVTSDATAQTPISIPLDQGFEVRAPAFPSGDERKRQPDLWMLDVDLKQMRMRTVEFTDPSTGENVKEQIWYLVYRVSNRPIRGADASATADPENTLDTPYTRPVFQPEFVLITYDSPADEIPDQTIKGNVLPEVVEKLRRIEERRAGVRINGSIETIRSLPEAADDVEPIYGIALFRSVDPDTDFFKVILRGFTNAYEVRDEADGKRIWRKVLVQKFKRPGDRFDPSQREFAFDGQPEWMYVPAEKVDNPDLVAASNDKAAATESTDDE